MNVLFLFDYSIKQPLPEATGQTHPLRILRARYYTPPVSAAAWCRATRHGSQRAEEASRSGGDRHRIEEAQVMWRERRMPTGSRGVPS